MSINDGANYAPSTQATKVVQDGEFKFAVAYLDHGHIYGQTNGLLDAGATLTKVYDPDPSRLSQFCTHYPQAEVTQSFEALLSDPDIVLVASAAIPNKRADIGCQVMQAGKHYFTDKSPFTNLQQLDEVKRLQSQTSQRYFVYYSERIHNDAAWHTGELINQGAVGRVIHVANLAPHRLSADSRPDWFFDKTCYGGIITDIGSHQVEQFLTYAGVTDAQVTHASVNNVNNPSHPGLEDFGEFGLVADNGAQFYSRIDWFTPQGSDVWGDGRTFVVGTEGSIEVRKYTNLGVDSPASKTLLTNSNTTQTIDCLDQTGFPFFGQMILDCLNGTEHAMTQAHIFKAAELSMRAQDQADQARSEG